MFLAITEDVPSPSDPPRGPTSRVPLPPRCQTIPAGFTHEESRFLAQGVIGHLCFGEKVLERKLSSGKKHWLVMETGTPEKPTVPAPVPATTHGRLDLPPAAWQGRLPVGLDVSAAKAAPVAAEMFTTEVSVPRQGPEMSVPT